MKKRINKLPFLFTTNLYSQQTFKEGNSWSNPKIKKDVAQLMPRVYKEFNSDEATILGCTEIPLALPEQQLEGTPLIDPMFVLARALIREVNSEKLRTI